MANVKSTGRLLIYSLLAVLLLFGLVEIIVNAKGLFLRLEFAGFLLLLALSFLGLAAYRSYGERLLFLVFLLYMGNLVLMWRFFDSLYLVLLFLSLIGLLMSFPQKRHRKAQKKAKQQEFTNPVTNEPASVVFDKSEPKVEIVYDEPEKVGAEKVGEQKSKSFSKEKAKENVTVKHSPGKYVASKSSNVYHEPRCDWAKKIKKDRQLWFAEKKDAQKKGYRKHSCVN